MVRKKRKGLVKESLGAGSEASGVPAAVIVHEAVAAPPVDARLLLPVEIDQRKTTPPVTTLVAWYAELARGPTLYEQLKMLQLYRAHVKKLAEDGASVGGDDKAMMLFTEATWRLMFRLYTARHPAMAALTKNFALVLQELVALHASSDTNSARLEVIARDELRMYLDQLVADLSTTAAVDDRVQAISQLQGMFEFSFLLRVLVQDSDGGASSYLLRTVALLADQLSVLVSPIAEYQRIHGAEAAAGDDDESDIAAGGPTNAVLMASERCSFALKATIVLGSLRETLYERLEASTPAVDFETLTTDFARLLDDCALILKTRVVHKDLLTQTGLAYCVLLRLLAHGTAITGHDGPRPPTTQLLLSAIYPETMTSSVSFVNARLQAHTTEDMTLFGDFARLAVLRGFVNSLTDDECLVSASSLGLPIQQSNTVTIMDFVFSTVQASCNDESLNTRLYAFQVLEAFLRRAVGIVQKHGHDRVPVAATTIVGLTSIVLLNWENPAKRVNQFMHLMFTHIVSYQVLTTEFESWKAGAVARLTQLPTHSRARYGGLSILVPRYGAKLILEENSGLLPSILQAVGIKDVSAAAAGLFTQILDELNGGKRPATEEALNHWRSYWVDDLVAVLLSPDAKLRVSVAMYALPLLLKKDPECVPSLIDKLRACDADSVKVTTIKDVKLWAIIEVLKFARKKIAPERLVGLSTAEIQAGLENSRPEARGAAFEALCASLKSTNLPTPDEIHLLKRFLVISAKEITASTRMNSLNSLKTVFFRVKEFLRIHTKETTAAANARISETEREFEAREVARAKEFQSWIELFVLTAVYPGALVQRTIIGLEVLYLYLQVFGIPAATESSLLMTSHMVTCLLNMLIGSWDVIRSLANSILDLYPPALPGYTTEDEMAQLWKWAMTLCISPRQRESDAGAHFMQLLYRRSHTLLQTTAATTASTTIRDPRVRFVLKLTEVIRHRLATANLQRGESPLVHGLLLSLRYIVDGTEFTALDAAARAEWQVALGSILESVQSSMKLSLAVVGDATSGVGDEKLSDTFEGVVGEVSAAGAKTSAIPLRVDCRGHLILEDGDANEDQDAAADTEQRAVVGSWLAARECGAILHTLMRRVPLPTGNADADLFSEDTARQHAEMLLNSLFELKHKGAVATAYEAFEGICKAFLAHGEKNPRIGGLPSAWADKLLDRLERSEQQFILRRSSGFAYSFVAILRAEPRNTAAIILPRVMSHLLRLASQDTDAMAAAEPDRHHLAWRSRVHALNILKLISQDAVLADDVAVYVSQMLEYAIFGFECRSWVVRNSSMMLFAAATQRALGDKRIADGASKLKIPSAEVFSRFPQLDGFLYRTLERFTRVEKDHSSSEGVAPPGLYPVLMFLSRLRPTDEHEDEELRARGCKPLADFIPLVHACASQSVLAIRHMAAQVLGSIVRVEQIVPILERLSKALPQGVRRPAATIANDTSVAPRKPLTTNYVHGVLLQAQALIEKCVEASATPASGATAMACAFITEAFLPAHLWLSSERVQCFSIRAVVAEITHAVLRHRHVAIPTTLMETLRTTVLTEIDRLAVVTVAAVPRSPGAYKYNRAIVGIFFSLLHRENHQLAPQWLRRVLALLEAPVLEVRKRAFKQLANYLDGPGATLRTEASVNLDLQRILLKQLAVETHPTVKARLLQLLIDLQTASSAPTPAAVAAEGTRAFLDLLANAADGNVVGPALKLLAVATGDNQQETEAAVLEALKDNILLRSTETQPLGLRHAAALALDRSNLLVAHRTQSQGSTEIAVDAWMAAIRLLQDDDSSVRDVIRQAVHRALTVIEPMFGLDSSASETAMLPAAIAYVVRNFGPTTYGLASLRSLLLPLIEAPTILIDYTTGAKAQDRGDLCGRIFEAEGNNFYAEPDLVAQLVAVELVELGRRHRASGIAELQREILAKLIESLRLLGGAGQSQWLGGMTYYSSVFPTLFSLLCAALAVFGGQDEPTTLDRTVRQDVADGVKLVLPMLQDAHPMIRQALEALAAAPDANTAVFEQTLKAVAFLAPTWRAIAESRVSA